MKLPIGLEACLLKCAQEELAILIVEENVLSLITPVEDMIDRPRILDMQLAWDWRQLPIRVKPVNCRSGWFH